MIPKFIVIHHSASPQNQTAKTINDYHKKLWNFKSNLGHYAGYHYIIEQDGNVFQAREDTEAGAHTKEDGMNYKSIGICIVGWYDDGHDGLPTENQQKSLKELLINKLKENNIDKENIKFHRDYAPKSCPGYHITKEFINKLIENKMNKDFVEIIEEIAGYKKGKLGDNINVEKEQPEVAKKLKEYKEEKEKEIAKGIESINTLQDEIDTIKSDNISIIVKNTQLEEKIEEYEIKIINQADMLKAKDIQIEKLKENSGDLASASFMQLLKEIKNRIINY